MIESTRETLMQTVAAYYGTKLRQHGATPRGVDWNDEASHDLRHRQFLRLVETFPESSVLDLGCGFGDFFRFLRSRGHRGTYVGYDIAPEMIREATRLYGEGANRRWVIGAKPNVGAADFAIASGIFNVKGNVPVEVWEEYVRTTINILARAGRRGFAFNLLSSSSDPGRRRADLYYADPVRMLADCLSHFGRSAALLQDYGLYEFTVIVRQPDRAASARL